MDRRLLCHTDASRPLEVRAPDARGRNKGGAPILKETDDAELRCRRGGASGSRRKGSVWLRLRKERVREGSGRCRSGSEGGRRVEAVESEDAAVRDRHDGALHFRAHSVAARRGAGRWTGEGKEREWEQPGAVNGRATALRRSAHSEEEPESDAAVMCAPPIPSRSVFESRADALIRPLPFMQMRGTRHTAAACSAGVRRTTSALLRIRAAARRRRSGGECAERRGEMMREGERGSTAHTLLHTHKQAATRTTGTSEQTTSDPPTAAAPTRASKARIDAATVKTIEAVLLAAALVAVAPAWCC